MLIHRENTQSYEWKPVVPKTCLLLLLPEHSNLPQAKDARLHFACCCCLFVCCLFCFCLPDPKNKSCKFVVKSCQVSFPSRSVVPTGSHGAPSWRGRQGRRCPSSLAWEARWAQHRPCSLSLASLNQRPRHQLRSSCDSCASLVSSLKLAPWPSLTSPRTLQRCARQPLAAPALDATRGDAPRLVRVCWASRLLHLARTRSLANVSRW
jgi:hypothetical protein